MRNEDFLSKEFYNESQKKLPNSNEVIIKKFKAITGIEERRYLTDDLKNSDIATIASQRAITASNVNPEELDYIILAQYKAAKQNVFSSCVMKFTQLIGLKL